MIQAKKIILGFFTVILVTFCFLAFIFYLEFGQTDFQFIVFDVGQGDAIFVRTPGHYDILIDGGPDNEVVYKLGEYLPFYDREIDLMVLTHPHADHVVGLIEVLNRYKVKKIFTTGVLYYSPDYLVWLDKIKEKNIPVEIIDSQRTLVLPDQTRLEILFPDHSLEGKEIDNVNNASIVAKLTYKETEILLTGDYEDEESLVEKGLDLSADILKSGHHGSDTGNDLEFLKAVDPETVVISCGEGNKFGHPHQATLDNLEGLGINVFRTDLQGDFVL